MRKRQWIAAALMVVSLAACDRRESKKDPEHSTTVRPPDSGQTEVTPPTSRPTTSRMLIADREYIFPAARLLLQSADPTVDVVLFSNDGRAALASKYTGNRYHMVFRLDINDPARIGEADYQVKATSQERIDTPDGIFLEGDKKQLQPMDVHVQFSKAGHDVQIEIRGTFLMFTVRDDKNPPMQVPVQALLVAELEDPRKK